MTTYILILILSYGNHVAQEFDTKESCVAAATSLRKELSFTKGTVIHALQCVRK